MHNTVYGMNHHWRTEKILDLTQAAQKADELRAAGKKIVSLNGSFDLLHAGHLDILEEGRQQGDVLFVGMNSDRSVKDGKGVNRPYIPEQERAALLAALICVDYVVLLDVVPYGKAQDDFILAVKPNVHVNGSEYGDPSTWVDKKAMDKVGAQGYTVARRPSLSSSDIITRIKNS